jgi:hypothetical protein
MISPSKSAATIVLFTGVCFYRMVMSAGRYYAGMSFKKKDSVSGLIRYNGTNLVQVLPDGERMADYNIKNISYDDIQYFRVYPDSSEPRNCYTDYVFLRPDFKVRVNLALEDKLSRQLGKKGKLPAYHLCHVADSWRK